MTLVAQGMIVEINGEKSRQLSWREASGIISEMERLFGELPASPEAFQKYLDRYCQKKSSRRLIITDAYI